MFHQSVDMMFGQKTSEGHVSFHSSANDMLAFALINIHKRHKKAVKFGSLGR